LRADLERQPDAAHAGDGDSCGAVMGGRGDDLIDLAKANLWE
jgi:hypothetical protein